MILINSAEFDYATIDLTKDIFFAGDNGTGKTSSIIALFYLFSGNNNSHKLGISADKKSFKEYYFPDERNSFLIYVFSDFFIFMYKQNGEVFKRFSKQVFNIEKIIQEDGRLQNFKKIQSYLKDTNLTYLAKSSEYREVIYGQKPQYLDFKITKIKNYDVFVELFNQTFNVDKSIVDANSIKRTIQKSLNIEEKNIEFNYQKYMEEIKKFQESYLFFRKFDQESHKITDTFKLQKELLETETSLSNLEANILYRQEVEIKLIDEKNHKILQLEELKLQYQLKKEQKEKSLNRMRKRFAKEIATLEKDIKDIEHLKLKFTPKSLETQQELFSKLPFLEKELLQKQQQLTLLEADVLNALKSIDQAIIDLKFQRDNDLVQQKRAKLNQLKIEESEKLVQKKEQLHQEREHTEHQIESEKESRQLLVEEHQVTLEEEKSKADELHNLYREKLNTFQEEQFKIKKTFQEKIENIEEESRLSKKKIKLLNEEREAEKQQHKKLQKKLAQNLWEERQYLNSTIKEKKAILFTVEGSFKEFLQQSGVSWEKELYHFMDSSLLSMSTSVLSPKIINAEQLLAIELNSKELKAIPTQEEAEESIREAKVKKQQLFKLYKEEKEKQNNEYEEQEKETLREIKNIETELEKHSIAVEEYRQAITKINTIVIPQYEKEIALQKEEELKFINQNIETNKQKILENKKQIGKLTQTLKQFIKEQQEELKRYQKQQKEVQEKEEEKINQWFKEEQKQINQEIEKKEKSKQTLSKDEVIAELKEALTQLKSKLEKGNDAKYYLEEYAKLKTFMESLARQKSLLIMAQQNQNNLENKLTKKQNDIIQSATSNEKALADLKHEIEQLNLGLEKGKNLKIEEKTPLKSVLYLTELIENYRQNQTTYKALRVDLKERLSGINSLKNNPFVDIHFKLENFSNFDKFSQDFETLEKLSELKNFKEKKLAILKETSNEKYFNFIKNEIPSKLGSLSHSEDKFQAQVKKINKNLSTIDFSIVKGIKINPEVGNKRSIMTLLNEMNGFVQNLTMTDTPESLFFDRPKTNQDLQKIATLLSEIKETLKGGAITLLDTIDLSLEFIENGTKKSNVTQIKNESSTGGTILLKMALAVSILGLYTQEKESTFFLILDEVSRLHSHNQDLLRSFANSRGFRIVFVTPEPVYAKPDEIKYYKFMRRDDNRFEVIGLNG